MIVIAGNSHSPLAHAIASKLSIPLILANSKKFQDQEWRVQIPESCHEQDVVIIQSTSNPANDHLMELLLLADTAKRAGSKRIIAVIPYFGYSRQDRPSYTLGPISASLVATLLEAAGIDQVMTIDLHSRQTEGFFRVGVRNLDPLPLFVPLFQGREDCIIVSPDVGGFSRAQRYASHLGWDLAVINKTRLPEGDVIMSEVIGNVDGKNCVLVDDIIDTGGTLHRALNLLMQKGAKSVSACVSHGVFSGDCAHRMAAAPFERFFVTDSIKHDHLPDKIQVVPLGGFIAESLL